MRKLGAKVLPAPLLCLLVAWGALAGPAGVTDSDNFDDFSLGAEWVTSPPQQAPQGVKVVDDAGNGRLTLADDYALGRADLKLTDLPPPPPPPKNTLLFTAKGVNLEGGGMFLRSVTLRVTRGTETVFGTVRAYKVKRDDADPKVEIAFRKATDTGPLTWADVSTVAIDGTADLVFSATTPQARLTFGGKPTPALSVAQAQGDTSLCRVEIQGNPHVQARPLIDEISAIRE